MELEHVKHVLTMSKLMLKLLCFDEFGGEKRLLHVNVVLYFIKTLLFEIKCCLLSHDYLALLGQPFTRLLYFLRELFKHDLLLTQLSFSDLECLCVELDKLPLFFKHTVVLP